MKDERLQVLLDAYLDGALSFEEKNELERLLLESDAARREFWKRCSLHGWSYQAAKLNAASHPETVPARPQMSESESTGAQVIAAIGGFRLWLRRLALAAACVAAIATGTFFVLNSSNQVADDNTRLEMFADVPYGTNAVAVLTRGTGVVWEDPESSAEIGSALYPGWYRLRSGAVQIEFNSGARVILEAPAELRLISNHEAGLRVGRLSAHVPMQARGFKIRSTGITVIDLGTEFAVVKGPSTPPAVHVFSGQVQLAPGQTNRPTHILNAGQAMEISPKASRSMPADRSAFVTPEVLAEREAAEQRARFETWKRNNRLIGEDPATLVHYTFEDTDGNGVLTNHAVRANPETHGSVVGCEWVDGRWPGKGALEFQRITDRVRFRIPGQTTALTYMMWARVDALPNYRNALVLPQNFREHEIHWQINNHGSLWFSIRRGDPADESGWDRIITTAPVVPANRFGQWMQFVAIYDGPSQRMSIYVNGERVDSKIIRQPVPLQLGTLEMGNWDPWPEDERMQRWFRGQGPEYRVRTFHGRIDELAVLARALTDEEIRFQYEMGKPRAAMLVADAESLPH